MLFDASRLRLFEVVNNIKPSNYFKRFFQNRVQRYCFFFKKHSQIVQIDSQIVQKCGISSQIAVFRHFKAKNKHKKSARGRFFNSQCTILSPKGHDYLAEPNFHNSQRVYGVWYDFFAKYSISVVDKSSTASGRIIIC